MIYLIFIPLLFIFISIIYWTLKNGIGPMPSSPQIKDQLLHYLPPMKKGLIYELGSGWGTLAMPIADKYPQCTVIGYENSSFPYYASILRLSYTHQKNLQFINSNIFEIKLDKADMVICYLYPGAMTRLKKKFETELPIGSLVVSHTFAVPGWEADKIIEVSDFYRTKIYMYYKKAEHA